MDTYVAISAGISGFNGMVLGYRGGKWYVILGKKTKVVPEEMAPLDIPYITLTSIYKN